MKVSDKSSNDIFKLKTVCITRTSPALDFPKVGEKNILAPL